MIKEQPAQAAEPTESSQTTPGTLKNRINKMKKQEQFRSITAIWFILLGAVLSFGAYSSYRLLESHLPAPSITVEAMSSVYTVEDTTRHNDYETFYAFDNKGNQIAAIKGGAKEVMIPYKTLRKISRHKNAVLTHNHPNQGLEVMSTYPISLADIRVASITNAKTIRAVGETADYEITRNGDKWQSTEQLEQRYMSILLEVDEELTKRRDSGEITQDYFGTERFNMTLYRLAKEFNLTYTKKERQ